MYAQQVFSALFTGVLNTITCVCKRGEGGVLASNNQCSSVSMMEMGKTWCSDAGAPSPLSIFLKFPSKNGVTPKLPSEVAQCL